MHCCHEEEVLSQPLLGWLCQIQLHCESCYAWQKVILLSQYFLYFYHNKYILAIFLLVWYQLLSLLLHQTQKWEKKYCNQLIKINLYSVWNINIFFWNNTILCLMSAQVKNTIFCLINTISTLKIYDLSCMVTKEIDATFTGRSVYWWDLSVLVGSAIQTCRETTPGPCSVRKWSQTPNLVAIQREVWHWDDRRILRRNWRKCKYQWVQLNHTK